MSLLPTKSLHVEEIVEKLARTFNSVFNYV
jgi:hypothetical protein